MSLKQIYGVSAVHVWCVATNTCLLVQLGRRTWQFLQIQKSHRHPFVTDQVCGNEKALSLFLELQRVCVCVCSLPSSTSVMPKGRDYLKVLSVSQVWLISAATNEDNTSHKQAVTFEDICHITLKCEIRQSWKEIHTLHNIWAPKLLVYLISESDWPFCLSF